MSLTITPSDAAVHPIILNGATTSNVTYTISNTTGVTYNITGRDADKFVVSYATYANDSTQKATLTLNTAADILTQILYKINLVATSVSDPDTTATLVIGIFVSSSPTDITSKNLTANTGAALISSIPELNTTSKASYPIAHTNVNDMANMTANFVGAPPTGFNAQPEVETISGFSCITLQRSTGADAADGSTDVNVTLTYSGAVHGNAGVGSTPSYTTATMTLTVNYTPVEIKFFKEAGLTNELASGTEVNTSGTAVATYYNGRNSVDNLSVTVIPDATSIATTHDIPVFLDQKCTWTQAGTNSTDFKIYPDNGSGGIDVSGGELNVAAASAWIRLERTAPTNYAIQKSYTTILTVTDAGDSTAGDSTQSRELPITIAVSKDTIIPVINDVSFNGIAYQGSITDSAVAFNVDEREDEAEIAKFKMDANLHGANDNVLGVDFFLDQSSSGNNCNTVSGSNSMTVVSTSGGSSATFSVTKADIGATNKEAIIKVANIFFKDNYTNASDNEYVFNIFAKDPVDPNNSEDVRLSSAPVTITVSVKNTTGMRYTGQDGSQTIAAVVSNGVVSNGGTTNSSLVEFSFVANIPASATAVTTFALTANPNDLTDGIYTGVATTGGSGSGATFDVTVDGGTITAAVANAVGTGYTTGDLLTILNTDIGGATDATITLTIDAAAPTATGGATAASLGITLLDDQGTSVNALNALMSSVVVTDIDHPLLTMRSPLKVKKFTFSVSPSPATTQYTLTMPSLTPATTYQNVSGQTVLSGIASAGGALPAANGMVDSASTFVFTYNASSEDVTFHGPDSVEWARGHPYTEIFYAAKVSSGATQSMDPTVTSAYGAKHNGLTGNKMSYYNSVDPTAEDGSVGFFTWTVTNAAGGQSSRTRTVTIKENVGGVYAGKTVRSPPDLRQDEASNLTFAGLGSIVTQPVALEYNATNSEGKPALKETTSPANNAAGDGLIISRTTALTTTNRNTLWTYASANNGIPVNASFPEIYNVINEDVYAYNFGINNTDVSQKSGEWAADTTGAIINSVTASHISQSGKKYSNVFDFTNTLNPTDLVSDGTYTGVATTVAPVGGSGATFDVTVAGGTITNITANAAGSGYNTSDVLTISHADIGVSSGTTTTSAITTNPSDLITGSTYLARPTTGGSGSGATFNVTVVASSSITTNPTDLVSNGTYTGVATTTTTGGTGTGATFDVTVAGGTITAAVPNAAGSGYSTGDVLTIAHGLIGVSSGNTNATITIGASTITTITPAAAGSGYTDGDVLTIAHGLIGGSAGATNALITLTITPTPTDAKIRYNIDKGGLRTNWDTDANYLGDITGKRTITMLENANHVISVDLAGLNLDQSVQQAFSLQAAEDFSATVDDFDNHAQCNIKMSKADFNNIFFYKPEGGVGDTDTGVGGIATSGAVWDQLLTSASLRSETICLLQKETNWPVMKSGNAAGDTVGTTNELYQITVQDGYKGTSLFQAGVPDTGNGNAIDRIVVENWTYDLFGVKNMADIFESTPAMKKEINDYLTSPGANTSNTGTFEGAIRTSLQALNGTVSEEVRSTGENDTQSEVNARPAQFLLYALRDKISGIETAQYRLTTSVGGIFHPNNKIVNAGQVDDGYYPFIWQTGDKITVGTNFKHADVEAGNLFGPANTTKSLGDLPFKFVITLE